jgi:chromosome segregation ATPase
MSEEDSGVIPRITLDEEDLADRQSQSAGSSAYSSGSASAAGEGTPGRSHQFLMLFLLLGALGGIGYLFMLLESARSDLVTAGDRIAVLENKLTSTDTSITQSEEALAAKISSIDTDIKTNKSEIRKLWGVSYDRNRKAIAENTQARKNQSKLLGDIRKSNTEMKSTAAALKETLEQLERELATLKSTARDAAQRIELVQEELSEITMASETLGKSQEEMRQQLQKRLKSVEESIKSIDVHRRNLDNDLRKVKQELVKRQAQPGFGAQ